MSAQFSADVRALFADMGIELEKTANDLVIDRFEQFGDGPVAEVRSIRASVCRFDALEAA
jgi:hypothetical protein